MTTFSAISDQPLDPSAVAARVDDPRAGAVATFTGVVRNHDNGGDVVGLDYSAHPQAGDVIERLTSAAVGADGVCRAAAVHRVGHLVVGDAAIVVAVSAEHRAQAFAACAQLVDDIKAQLPVWKHQHFVDGTDEWVGLGSIQPRT